MTRCGAGVKECRQDQIDGRWKIANWQIGRHDNEAAKPGTTSPLIPLPPRRGSREGRQPRMNTWLTRIYVNAGMLIGDPVERVLTSFICVCLKKTLGPSGRQDR